VADRAEVLADGRTLFRVNPDCDRLASRELIDELRQDYSGFVIVTHSMQAGRTGEARERRFFHLGNLLSFV